MYTNKKYTLALLVAMALAVTPLMAGMAYAEAPKARAIQDGVSLDESTPGNLIDDIDCVGGIETSEDTAYTICYLVPDGVPTPDYDTDPSVVSQTGTPLLSCPLVGGFGATQECFSTTFGIGLFSPIGHWRFVIEFYDEDDELIAIEGIDLRVHSFFVLPESPIGVAALVMSSLAVLGGFMFLRRRNHSQLPI
ncbi:MAG: hypothetical protein ACREBU_11580 [Nitrososphaera sp.]